MAAALRMDLGDIASLVGYKENAFRDLMKRDDTINRAIDEGRSKASARIGGVLFKKASAGDPHSLNLWYKFIEQRAIKIKQEIAGRDGGPIEYINMSDEELKAIVSSAEDRSKKE